MHTTLDGFVAGPAGEMDWINVDSEIFELAGQQTDEADTALYGRVTYEMMEGYWPTAADKPNASKHDIQHSNWYNSVTKIVLSESMKGKKLKNTIILGKKDSRELAKLKEQDGKNILVFGSPTAVHLLLEEDLIDDFWLFVNPVILGKGISLFGGLNIQLKLKLISTKTFQSGVVCLHYEK